jgi:hypothetical protein
MCSRGFTFKNILINGCRVGFGLTTGGLTEAAQTAGSIVVLDSKISATLAAVQVLKESASGNIFGTDHCPRRPPINRLLLVALSFCRM